MFVFDEPAHKIASGKNEKKKAEKKSLGQIKNTKKPSKTGSASPQRVPLQYDTVIQFLVWLSVGGRGGEEAVTHAGSSHAGPFVPPEISPISRSPPPPPARTHATGRETHFSHKKQQPLWGGEINLWAVVWEVAPPPQALIYRSQVAPD